jgi:hypothetical protein
MNQLYINGIVGDKMVNGDHLREMQDKKYMRSWKFT